MNCTTVFSSSAVPSGLRIPIIDWYTTCSRFITARPSTMSASGSNAATTIATPSKPAARRKNVKINATRQAATTARNKPLSASATGVEKKISTGIAYSSAGGAVSEMKSSTFRYDQFFGPSGATSAQSTKASRNT